MTSPIALRLFTGLLAAPALLGGAGSERRVGPTVGYFSPTSGPAGTTVQIYGWGLSGASRVTFGGVAAPFTAKNDYSLTATVPAGAVSGPIAVTTPKGTGKSFGSFTVKGTATAPAVASFTPAQGPVGTTVSLAGSGFTAGAKVAFNGTAAASVTFVSASQLKAAVPAGATTGPITVTTAGGSARSAASFTVTTGPAPAPGAPALTSFAPAQGPVGAMVVLTGTGFTSAAKVAFNGTAAASVTYVSATELQATVPAGATTGPIAVTTAAGTARSAASFTVQSGTASLDLALAGWYLTQSVQDMARAVPLVAGRDGCLRVFVKASAANQVAPPVRVTVTGGSPSPWVQTIQAPVTAVPTTLGEGSLGSSWNLQVPGAVLAPGATLKLELDPSGAIPDANRANNALQASLDVRAAKPWRTTLIPVTQQGLTGNVTGGRTLASWVDRARRMYPLSDLAGGVEVTLGAPYTTQANLNSGSTGWSQLLSELERKRKAEASDRCYFGAVAVSYSGGIAGIGYIGNSPSAVGWDKSGYDDGGNYPEVLAHEVGHNFGRQHAPCGVSSSDPDWPTDTAHAGAKIGVFGYDRSTRALKTPSTLDIMAYCHPNWVSDYTYKAVLAYRAANGLEETPGEGQAAPPATKCLLVSGTLRDGTMELDPGYTLVTRPSPPEGDEFILELQNGDGCALRRVPFSPVAVADLPGVQERHFSFALPLDAATLGSLRAMRVLSGHGVLALRQGGLAGPPHPPAAAAAGMGLVRVTWNAQASPTAMIRDPRDGSILAFAQGGSVDVATTAGTLDVALSNGVVSYPFQVKVTPQ